MRRLIHPLPISARDYAACLCGGLVLTLLFAAPAALAERDSGSSLNLLLKADLNDDWFVISRSNLASRNDHDEFFFGYTGASLGYQINDQWSLRAGYRHAWIKLGDWLEEDRPFAEAYFSGRLGDYRVTNRARVEFRLFDYRENDVRLRNEITVEAPWSLTALELRPYLEEEAFYSTDAGQFEANWLGGGLAWRPAKGVKLKAGYRWNRFRVGDDWRDRDVLVLGLNVFY
jgi:opacity protein-like surface antigen